MRKKPTAALSAAAVLGAAEVLRRPFRGGRAGRDDPPERFVRSAEREGVLCVTPRLGEKMLFGDRENHTRRW